jgi:hypothetical protein
MRNISDESRKGIQNTLFMFNIFLKIEIMWENIVQTDRQVNDDNMAHAHCMLDN